MWVQRQSPVTAAGPPGIEPLAPGSVISEPAIIPVAALPAFTQNAGHERTDPRRRAFGQSLLAEQRAQEFADQPGRKVIYIATAQALDGEMARRVAHHRARRPAEWGCVEETLHLPQRLRELAAPDTCLLVDCLTPVAVQPALCRPGGGQAEAGAPSTARCSANKPRR